MSEADNGMTDIVENVSRVQQLVDEISRASDEQSDGISQINVAMGQIDTTTQQNASLVEESSAASASLKDQARLLLDAIRIFVLHEKDVKQTSVERKEPHKVQALKQEKQKTNNENWETF